MQEAPDTAKALDQHAAAAIWAFCVADFSCIHTYFTSRTRHSPALPRLIPGAPATCGLPKPHLLPKPPLSCHPVLGQA